MAICSRFSEKQNVENGKQIQSLNKRIQLIVLNHTSKVMICYNIAIGIHNIL